MFTVSETAHSENINGVNRGALAMTPVDLLTWWPAHCQFSATLQRATRLATHSFSQLQTYEGCVCLFKSIFNTFFLNSSTTLWNLNPPDEENGTQTLNQLRGSPESRWRPERSIISQYKLWFYCFCVNFSDTWAHNLLSVSSLEAFCNL